MKLIAASYVTHIVGFLLFWAGWVGTFGVEPRVIPISLDIAWPLFTLFVAAVAAIMFCAFALLRTERPRRTTLLCAPSLFLSTTWLYSVSTILGWW